MTWEVDWSHSSNTGTKFMARNTDGRTRRVKDWHLTCAGYLRSRGVNTPVYRSDSWEIDWSKRDVAAKLVWARNVGSKMPSAREWHWIDQCTVSRAGLQWKPVSESTGRCADSNGYVVLTRRGMTDEQIAVAVHFGLFRGTRKTFVREHQVVACMKYKRSLVGCVVRHLNGIKDDNRPENLVIGTTQENTMDHNSARLAAMYWHSRFLELEAEVAATKRSVKSLRTA